MDPSTVPCTGLPADISEHVSTSNAPADPNEEDFISSVHSGHEQSAVTASPQQNALPREPTKWHWKKGAQLGKGAYGVVHLAHLVDTGQLVAVKQVCPFLCATPLPNVSQLY